MKPIPFYRMATLLFDDPTVVKGMAEVLRAIGKAILSKRSVPGRPSPDRSNPGSSTPASPCGGPASALPLPEAEPPLKDPLLAKDGAKGQQQTL